MRIATTLAEVDGVCDYIPFVSTVSNIVDLFQKCVYKCIPENIAKNRYWTHIKYKEIFRCIILLLPILGNLYIIIDDYLEYKEVKADRDRAMELKQRSQRNMAGMLAMLARQSSGQQVTAEQMMPAPTEDEQRLWAGCFSNDLQVVQEQLNKGISPNFYHGGNTPLVTACQHGSIEIVRLLLEHHAEANTADLLGHIPFIAACTKGDLETVRLLRPHIQNIDAIGPRGTTALMFASAQGHREIVEFLIAQGADLQKKAADGGDAVTNAMFLHDRADLLPLLFGEEENVDERRYQFQIPSFNLFSLFAPPTICDLTPLLYATLVGAEKSAVYLVGRSNVQHLDSTLSNALYYASKHMELLQALLAKCNTPEFVNHRNIAGSTALHHALELDQPAAALLLLQNGANPLIPDGPRGVLIAAVDEARVMLPEVAGIVADYTLENKDNKPGKTPLILACEKGFDTVVAYIQEHYGSKIGPKMQEQVALATRAFQERAAQGVQEQPERQDGGLSAAFGLMKTALTALGSLAKRESDDAKEVEDLGPTPRTGMEMLLGRHPE